MFGRRGAAHQEVRPPNALRDDGECAPPLPRGKARYGRLSSLTADRPSEFCVGTGVSRSLFDGTGALPNIDERRRPFRQNSALQALEWPHKPRWWHYLGRELFYHRWYRSAIAVLETHAAMQNAWSAERSQSLCFIGESLEALGP